MPREARDNPIGVEARKPLRQRSGRVLPQDTEARAGEREALRDKGGGQAGHIQIHRALLQHEKDTFRIGVQVPRQSSSARALKNA